MTDARDVADILAERLRVVLALTEANAAHRLSQSKVSAAALEIIAIEDHPGATAASELNDARQRGAEARARMEEAATRIAALESALDRVDQELATRTA